MTITVARVNGSVSGTKESEAIRTLAAIIAERGHMWRRSTLLGLLLLGALALVPIWSTGSFGISRFGVAVTYVTAAVGLNLAIGFAGELVLGHAAIMAISAYVAGMLSARRVGILPQRWRRALWRGLVSGC